MLRKVQNKKDVLRTHTLLTARVSSSKPQEDRGSQNCPMVVFGTDHVVTYLYTKCIIVRMYVFYVVHTMDSVTKHKMHHCTYVYIAGGTYYVLCI